MLEVWDRYGTVTTYSIDLETGDVMSDRAIVGPMMDMIKDALESIGVDLSSCTGYGEGEGEATS